MRNIKIQLLSLISLALFTTSCEHKDIYIQSIDTTPEVAVAFDWSNLDGDDMASQQMALYCYNTLTDSVYNYTINDASEISTFNIPVGTYRTVYYTIGAENITNRNSAEYDTHELIADGFTSSTPSIYGGCGDMVVQAMQQTDDNQRQLVTITPQLLSHKYTFYIQGLNLKTSVNSWNATLTGMSSSLLPSTGEPSLQDLSTTATFSLSDNTSYITSVRMSTFGPRQKFGASNKLYLGANYMYDSTVYYIFDITEDMQNGEDTFWLDIHDATISYEGDANYPAFTH